MYEMEERTDTHYFGGGTVVMRHPIWRSDRQEKGERAVYSSPGLVECFLQPHKHAARIFLISCKMISVFESMKIKF